MEQQPPAKHRPGRPTQHGNEVKRAFFQTRIRESLKQRLMADAAKEGRSLSEEVELRLEESLLDDFTVAQRHLGRRLIGHYLAGGPAAVVRFLTGMPDPVTYEPPDAAEKERRWRAMRDQIEQARWASPEREAEYQRIQRKVAEWNASFKPAAKPDDEAA